MRVVILLPTPQPIRKQERHYLYIGGLTTICDDRKKQEYFIGFRVREGNWEILTQLREDTFESLPWRELFLEKREEVIILFLKTQNGLLLIERWLGPLKGRDTRVCWSLHSPSVDDQGWEGSKMCVKGSERVNVMDSSIKLRESCVPIFSPGKTCLIDYSSLLEKITFQLSLLFSFYFSISTYIFFIYICNFKQNVS